MGRAFTRHGVSVHNQGMSTLRPLDRIKLEKYLEMGSGYVCDFSDRTFGDFVLESTGIDVYTDEYAEGGTSKANRLRTFWRKQPDAAVAKLMGDMLEYWKFQQADRKKFSEEQRAKHESCVAIIQSLGTPASMPGPQSPIPDKTDEALAKIGAQLPEMRRGMWEPFKTRGPDAGRQAAHSARELIDQTLKEGAPTSLATRKERAAYIMEHHRGIKAISDTDLEIIDAQWKVIDAENRKLLSLSHGRLPADIEEARGSVMAAERVLEILFGRG